MVAQSVRVNRRRSMGFSKGVYTAIVVILVVCALFSVVATTNSAGPRVQPAVGGVKAPRVAPQLPFSKSAKYFDPALQGTSGLVSVLVATDKSLPAADVAKYLMGARALPEFGAVRVLRGMIESSRISELQSSPGVLAILKDRSIG